MVSGCIGILDGDDVDERFHRVLAGPAADPILRGLAGGVDGYWPRVWAMRGLIYAWEDRAERVVLRGTGDSSWRVREMAAKVIARHKFGDAIEAAANLQRDPVRRVRSAAERALCVLTTERA